MGLPQRYKVQELRESGTQNGTLMSNRLVARCPQLRLGQGPESGGAMQLLRDPVALALRAQRSCAGAACSWLRAVPAGGVSAADARRAPGPGLGTTPGAQADMCAARGLGKRGGGRCCFRAWRCIQRRFCGFDGYGLLWDERGLCAWLLCAHRLSWVEPLICGVGHGLKSRLEDYRIPPKANLLA